jgi:hypothetical protein
MTALSTTTYNGSASASTIPADAPMPSFLREVGITATDLFLEAVFEAMVDEYHDEDESIISQVLTDVSDPCSYMSWSEFYGTGILGFEDDAEWYNLYARNYGERVDIRSASFISFLSTEQTVEERRDFALGVWRRFSSAA